MRVVIAAVGHPRDRALAAAIADYETRAGRYWPMDVREVREEGVARSGRGPARIRDRESARLMAALAPGALVVACDADGAQWSSAEFASWLQRQREQAAGDVAFLLGGAYGLAGSVRDRAGVKLSFSRWTLPHELARLVLAEQLYRAGTIVRGEPYHK